MTKWKVWLSDGTTRDSAQQNWSEFRQTFLNTPGHPKIQVVRWWRDNQQGIHWSDSFYGDPDTWIDGEVIDEEAFEQILEIAHGDDNPPA